MAHPLTRWSNSTSAGAVLLMLSIALALLGRPIAQGVVESSPPITLHVVDERGQPLATGTELVATAWSAPDPAALGRWVPSGIGPEPSRVVVGSDGTVHFTPRVAGFGGIDLLRLEHPPVRGRGARALVPLRALPDRIALVAEERLAAGTIVDQAGAAVPNGAASLNVVGDDSLGLPALLLLDPRWVMADGAYELWGWRADGSFWVTATYADLGPSAPRSALVFGATDLNLTLPMTGCVQVQLATPKPFPRYGAAFAVLRDLDRGGVHRHSLEPNDATNIRTLAGRFAVTLELNGVIVHDCGTLTVTHNHTTEVKHDLRPRTRVFRIEVVGDDGNPILPARVRVVGSPDESLARQPVDHADRQRYAFVVATTAERVDLEVSEHGSTEVMIVKGVDGDRTIELTTRRR